MPFQRIDRRRNLKLNRYDKEGYILIPPAYRKYFGNRVKLLFDSEKNLLALQPSSNDEDFPTTKWRVWCSSFFQQYNILTQNVEAIWDEEKNYLIAKIKRE